MHSSAFLSIVVVSSRLKPIRHHIPYQPHAEGYLEHPRGAGVTASQTERRSLMIHFNCHDIQLHSMNFENLLPSPPLHDTTDSAATLTMQTEILGSTLDEIRATSFDGAAVVIAFLWL